MREKPPLQRMAARGALSAWMKSVTRADAETVRAAAGARVVIVPLTSTGDVVSTRRTGCAVVVVTLAHDDRA